MPETQNIRNDNAHEQGIRFLSLLNLMTLIALEKLKIRWFLKPLTICEYREDGLTKGSFQLEKDNPMGFAMMYNQRLKYTERLKDRFMTTCQLTALSAVGHNLNYLLKSNDLVMTFWSLIPGLLLSIRRKIQYRD